MLLVSQLACRLHRKHFRKLLASPLLVCHLHHKHFRKLLVCHLSHMLHRKQQASPRST